MSDEITEAMELVMRASAETTDWEAQKALLRCYATLAELRRVVLTMAALGAAKGRAQ